MPIYHISCEDALDHDNLVDSFDTYEAAKASFDEIVANGPEYYDMGLELIKEENEEWDTIEYHQWYADVEAWEAANPNGLVAS